MTDYSSYKVLAVDDHQLSLKLVTKQLEAMGFSHIDLVTNGQEALEKLEQDNYQIVIFDWAMPVMDGLAFLKICRANPKFDKTAFVMISSETESEAILKIIKEGATSYITKPVVQADMQEKIGKVVSWLKSQKA